jgi:hypothetical protein
MKMRVKSLGEDYGTLYSSLRGELPSGPKRGVTTPEIMMRESSTIVLTGFVGSRTWGSSLSTTSRLGETPSMLSAATGSSRVRARRWECPKRQVF